MTEPTRNREPRERRDPTANDRFKSGWSTRLAWSIMAAAIAHGALFGFRPDWRATPPTPDSSLERLEMEWIALTRLPDGGRKGVPSAGVPVGEVDDSATAEPDLEASTGSVESRMASGTEALRDRLFGADAPVPTLSEPEPEPAVEEPPAADTDSTTVGGRASTAEIPQEPGGDTLDLDRLSAVRPGLSFRAASSWVLIRNPVEVERFLERASDRRNLGGAEKTSVSVTLWIDESGSVEWTEIHESSGREELDQVALALFEEVAAFRPARDEGVRVPKSVIFTVHFPW